MSLTLGTGPLAPQRAGELDSGTHVSGHALYLEPLARRVRGYLGGEVVVDVVDKYVQAQATAAVFDRFLDPARQ